MGSLRIDHLKYDGDNYTFSSPSLNSSLVIIEGKNGNGKSTFSKLLYHAFGGSIDEFKATADEQHKEIVNDKNNYVELSIRIDNLPYIIRRFINDNEVVISPIVVSKSDDGEITVEIDSASVEVLPINRSQQKPRTFSDWLLEKLGVSVIDINYGSAQFKLNFTDIGRLIYYDQSTEVNKIYKSPENDGYVSDSLLIRKIIFEMLLGKSYSTYYDAISKTKVLEKQKSAAKAILDEYQSISNELRGKEEPKNITFLQKQLQDNDAQLEKLHASREALKKPKKVNDSFDEIESIKSHLSKLEIESSNIQKNLLDVLSEKSKLIELKFSRQSEIDQISKILHTHSQLQLFSADTCPYCLSKVDRPKDHCVCGAKVDEAQYERFFYTDKEYKELLKSKLVSIRSVDLAIESCSTEEKELLISKEKIEKELLILREKLSEKITVIDDSNSSDRINDIDDKILEKREDNSKLLQRIEIESKLDNYEKTYDSIEEKVQAAKRKEKQLELAAQEDISSKVKSFSVIYNELMTSTLESCRSAKIDPESYMPIINDYEYKEDSSKVLKRLMYFFSLLKISLTKQDVLYPKFLLIDTPQNMGIDHDKLLLALSQLEPLLESYDDQFQVILTTGYGKYPDAFRDKVVLRLSDDDKLLKPK